MNHSRFGFTSDRQYAARGVARSEWSGSVTVTRLIPCTGDQEHSSVILSVITSTTVSIAEFSFTTGAHGLCLTRSDGSERKAQGDINSDRERTRTRCPCE
jgi:hypothetical protein